MVKQFEEGNEDEEMELGTKDNPIRWEPTCPSEQRDYADDAATISRLFNFINFDHDFLFPILSMNWKYVVTWFIEPAVESSCDAIMLTLKCYLQGEHPDNHGVAADAIVFYRRHSPQLKAHLMDTEVDFLENMCCVLRGLLRTAGWSVRNDGLTFPP
jgi:hypothetical protein